MLLILGAFALMPLILPWLTARIGARAFYVAAVLPIVAFAQAVALSPAVFAGDPPFESYAWITPLGIELSMRMDTLGWLMALIVTGVGALVMIYCRWYFRGRPTTSASSPPCCSRSRARCTASCSPTTSSFS
nr:hypothetical protein GCM10025699_08480 [Microbacterium flavescens]